MPHKSSIPIYWRLRRHKYNLIGSKCYTCSAVFYPPRKLCTECRRKGDLKEFKFSGKGEVLSYTVIHAAPEGFEKNSPYAVAIISLEEGTNISAPIVGDPTKIQVGKKVRPIFRKIYEDNADGLIHYGLKFEIVDSDKN